ncbi:MAG: urea transporter [Betaproteobacteria bacterium]|nr:urea transporter [Betaproteobacteria bacterium]
MSSVRRGAGAAEALLRAYAAVLFCDSPRVGAWFMLLTWCSPRAAAAGLIGLACTALWARAFSMSLAGAPHLVNGLLVGLFMGAFYPFDWRLAAWLAGASLFTTLCAHWFAALLWRAGKLPVLSLPFVLACWIGVLASPWRQAVSNLEDPFGAASYLLPVATESFFASLGWLFLVPYPVAGALLFAGLIVASRYLALLALAGYAAGQAALWLSGSSGADLYGFNYMLAAMALGGIFSVPSRTGFAMAAAGGALTAWLALALGAVLQPLQLPLLTLPFIAGVYLWLGALGVRTENRAPRMVLDAPEPPERGYERARIAQVRGSALDSVALMAPFFGEWRVSQSFDGPHTHRSPWQHALDVEIVEAGRNRRCEREDQRDYFCFGTPVVAPAASQVVGMRDDLADMPPGDADVANNWGNFLLLRTAGGEHILLAHLKQGSVRAKPGEWVVAGQQVASCGSSGRAPEPHLHFHVQSSDRLGAPTRAFHLANVLVRNEGGEGEFRLYHVPCEGELVSSAPRDDALASALRMPQGRTLAYALTGPYAGHGAKHVELQSGRTLLGQSRLTSASGASAAFEETPYVVGHFDRQGGRDRLLDLWLLCLGLTPLSTAAGYWRDRPALALLPLGPLRRAAAALARPLGAACESTYRRKWDEGEHAWRQDGEHRFSPLPGVTWIAHTSAWITPGRGVARLGMQMFGRRWGAVLEDAAPANADSNQSDQSESIQHNQREVTTR